MTPDERQNCFRALVDRNSARWGGIARSYANESDRDDLLQEIMLQVWKSLDAFKGESSIDTWAYRVALNTALAWARTSQSHAAKLQRSSSDVDAVARDVGSQSFETRVLDAFLASLSKVDRAVMLLFLDDVPNADAAEIMGMTEGALRVRLHRIRKTFETDFCDRRSEQ